MKRANYMVTEGGVISGDKHAIEYTDVVLQSCTTEIDIINNKCYTNKFNLKKERAATVVPGWDGMLPCCHGAGLPLK